jgi:hypothetical protein
MPRYLQVTYTSRKVATEPEAAAVAVLDILAVAREVNVRVGVTGALLSGTSRFAQVLEGPAEAVEPLFDRIRVDPRHDDLVLLPTRMVTERMFPHWSMGLVTPNDADELMTATQVLDQVFALPDEAAATATRELIRSSMEKVELW